MINDIIVALLEKNASNKLWSLIRQYGFWYMHKFTHTHTHTHSQTHTHTRTHTHTHTHTHIITHTTHTHNFYIGLYFFGQVKFSFGQVNFAFLKNYVPDWASAPKKLCSTLHYWSIILACVRRRHFGSVTITFHSLKFSKKKYFES